MRAIFLDTHVVVWLFGGFDKKLPDMTKALIEANELYISPIVILEIQYLKEIGRINFPAKEIINDLRGKIGLLVDDLPFESATQKATEISWTRDPFDRLIASQVILRGYPLITKDNHILANLPLAVWDTPKSITHVEAKV